MAFINKHNLISNNQYDFREGKNTSQAMAELRRNTTTKLEEKKKCAAIFLDLTKAFDSVSHEKVRKNRHMGSGTHTICKLSNTKNSIC